MPRRLKLVIAYDGGAFAGWQSQTHRNTIQDHLERAFQRVTGKRIPVHGAGRTDAGVHALGQCAHVDLPDKRLSRERWTAALNALLPPTIRVLRCRYVSEQFHARFSAIGKVYRYRVWTAGVLPPLEYGRAWHVLVPLDFELLTKGAAQFAGTHDFARFAANRGRPQGSSVRTIHSVRVRHSHSCVTIEFDGDGFLYKMVRLLIGSLVGCASGKLSLEQIAEQLDSGRAIRSPLAAPAQGLFLVRVRY